MWLVPSLPPTPCVCLSCLVTAPERGRGEGGPRSGFLQDQDTAAASTRQRLESYICGICEPAPGCILVTGHHSVSKTRGSISPKPRPQMTSGSAFWEYCELSLLWYCEHWMLEIADLSCRHWDILVWLNSSLPNIFHRIVSKGVLELIQKKNKIQWKYIFFWRGFYCRYFLWKRMLTRMSILFVSPSRKYLGIISDDRKLIS